MMKWIASCSGLVVGAVAIGACMGTVEGGDADEALPDRAVLVSQKRQWLESFDRHCDACFAAFELCERGAEADELDACTIAMDACVRGGMLGDDAAVDDDRDAGDASEGEDEDAGFDEADAGFDEADASFDDADAGSEEAGQDAGERDDGEDADAGSVDADAGIDGGSDSDDSDGLPGLDDRERAKEVLISQIGVCLDLARSCLEPRGSDAAQCVSGLGACVQQALEEAFEVVCSEQVRACRAEKQSRANVERVERECRANLLP